MSRDTVASVTSAAAAPLLRYQLLAEVDVRSSTMYLCTGDQFIWVGSREYSPVGGLGGVSVIKEDADSIPRGITLWLRNVTSADMAESMSEAVFGKETRIFRTFLDQNGTVVGTPQRAYRGYLNKAKVVLGDPDRGNFFEVEYDSRLARESRSARFNQETLWQSYSGDTFFAHLHKVPLYRSRWGEMTNNPTNAGAGANNPPNRGGTGQTQPGNPAANPPNRGGSGGTRGPVGVGNGNFGRPNGGRG